jgi:DnaJ-class molecular chaperone
MYIESIEQARTFLHTVFGLQPPITLAELKRAFHKRALEVHPDLTGKANGDEFVAVKEAFDALTFYPELFVDWEVLGSSRYVATTDDGTLLSTLGHGFGMPEANTQKCYRCGGRGWDQVREEHITTVWDYPDCWECFGTGSQWWGARCPKCGGDGKFKKHGKRRMEYRTTTVHPQPKKCVHCGGVGEIRFANPVIPPGKLLLCNRLSK